ncbi:hypothetical protein ABPG77_001986 [Micractinium sp. CCAP 211/92]
MASEMVPDCQPVQLHRAGHLRPSPRACRCNGQKTASLRSMCRLRGVLRACIHPEPEAAMLEATSHQTAQALLPQAPDVTMLFGRPVPKHSDAIAWHKLAHAHDKPELSKI